ncbi:MAG: hypothetical protein H6843_00945 [Rhodospirillaceae bacterium]|nr:hypothetical protein [Rhodospirillaceae bacterium]
MATSLRDRLIGGFTGAVMAAGAILPASLASHDAQAQVDLTCPAEIQVPCADLRGERAEVVRTAAARASLGPRVVLIYYGNDDAARQTAETVVQYFNDNGVQTGLLLADGSNQYEIYIDTQTYTEQPFGASISAVQLGERLNRALATYQALLASIPGEDPEPTGGT